MCLHNTAYNTVIWRGIINTVTMTGRHNSRMVISHSHTLMSCVGIIRLQF
jgi:hypothetical protein